MRFRKRLYITLAPREKGGFWERTFEIILIAIITLNMMAIIISSIPKFYEVYGRFFYEFEIFSAVFFALEYIARVYSVVEHPRYRHPIKGRLRYMVSPLAIVDLLAFLPSLIFIFLPFTLDLRFLRLFRLTALFRIFKFTRYLRALDIFKRVVLERKEQLLLSFILLLFVLIIISFSMYYVERDVQPEKFSSIPATMWWSVVTLTTVGYGDIVPVTALGKSLAGIFTLAGVGLLALPAGILSAGFYEVLLREDKHKDKENGESKRCPHCGEPI